MRNRLMLLAVISIAVTHAAGPSAQFRRGMFSESTEVMLYPIDVPALLLPAGNVQIEVRNASTASARIVEQLEDLIERQLADNDSRLTIAPKADVIVAVTLLDWAESRRNSTKYVSETRQVGTRQVKDAKGNVRDEPIYEYGRNRPSVVINASAGLRVEVRRGRGAAIADETVRHTINEEHLADASPPSRDAIEDALIDRVVQKGAGRISPGRTPTRVLLARSDEVDRFNSMAQNRRWHDWFNAISALKPHRDPRRDAYRLHNLAVAHEAIAYESTSAEDWTTRLNLANALIKQALAQNPKERYIVEAAERIAASSSRYAQLIDLYRSVAVTTPPVPPPAPPAATAPPAVTTPPPAATPATPPAAPPVAATKPAPSAPATPPAAAKRPAQPRALPKAPPLEATDPPKPASMTNRDVIDLRAAGLDDDNLVAAINEAKTTAFDLSPAGLKALLTAKVSNRVIAAMRARK